MACRLSHTVPIQLPPVLVPIPEPPPLGSLAELLGDTEVAEEDDAKEEKEEEEEEEEEGVTSILSPSAEMFPSVVSDSAHEQKLLRK